MAGRRASALVAGFSFLAMTAAADAHGPCACLDPQVAEVGATVRIATVPAYRVIFNPRPGDLGIAPSYLAGAYRPDAATKTVLSRSRRAPARHGRFRVPDVPPGLFMVLIFDGEEGGVHNTWDYVHVVDRGNDVAAARGSRSGPQSDPDWVLTLAVAAVGALLGGVSVATWRAVSRAGRPASGR